MYRLIILVIFLISHVFVLGQERFVKRAVESMQNGDFAESLDQITKYLEKEPLQPYGYLLHSRWLSNRANPFANPDSAYNVILQAMRKYSSLGSQDAKEVKKDVYLMYVAFHQNELAAYLDTVAKMAYEQTLIANNIELYDAYSEKYSKFSYANDAKAQAEHLRYLNVVKVDNIESYQKFINDYPRAADVPKANYRIHELAFVEARLKGTLEAFREYVYNYPKSHLLDRAWKEIHVLDYNQVINSNDVSKLENHLSSYPTSIYYDEVRNKLYEVAYQRVLEIKTSQACASYIQKYPESPYKENCFNLEMNLKWQELNEKDDLTVQDLDQYLIDYPNTPHRDAVKVKQASLQFAKISNSEDPSDFIGFMNEFPDSEEYPLAKKTAISLLQNKATALINQDELTSAQEVLDKIQELDINNAFSYFLYAHILKEQGSTSEAIAKLSRAIQLDSKNADFYAQRGLYNIDDTSYAPNTAYQDFVKSISIDPSLPKGNLGLAIINDRNGEYATAINYYRKALNGGYDVSDRIDYLESYLKQIKAQRVERASNYVKESSRSIPKNEAKKTIVFPKPSSEKDSKSRIKF